MEHRGIKRAGENNLDADRTRKYWKAEHYRKDAGLTQTELSLSKDHITLQDRDTENLHKAGLNKVEDPNILKKAWAIYKSYPDFNQIRINNEINAKHAKDLVIQLRRLVMHSDGYDNIVNSLEEKRINNSYIEYIADQIKVRSNNFNVRSSRLAKNRRDMLVKLEGDLEIFVKQDNVKLISAEIEFKDLAGMIKERRLGDFDGKIQALKDPINNNKYIVDGIKNYDQAIVPIEQQQYQEDNRDESMELD